MSTRWPQSVLEPFLSKSGDDHYEPLRPSEGCIEELQAEVTPVRKRAWPVVTVVVLLLMSMIASGAAGFVLGNRKRESPMAILATPGNIKQPMTYNQTFSKEPSLETDTAWDSLFPLGVGFIKHPDISPSLSGLAIFHQLHCVNMLRVGYYAALNGKVADMQHVHDHNKRPDPHHLRHCFDYLRQSLMCAVDTNLEPVDFELGGVTGWGFERTCRDFGAVKEWAEMNRAWDERVGEPISL